MEGFTEVDYDVIDIKKTYRLAQRPASYVVLCYEQPVVKMKQSKEIHTAIMVMNVLERSVSSFATLQAASTFKRCRSHTQPRHADQLDSAQYRAIGTDRRRSERQHFAKSGVGDG